MATRGRKISPAQQPARWLRPIRLDVQQRKPTRKHRIPPSQLPRTLSRTFSWEIRCRQRARYGGGAVFG